MPNNCLSVLYKHIIQVENKNMGLKVRGGGGAQTYHSLPPPPLRFLRQCYSTFNFSANKNRKQNRNSTLFVQTKTETETEAKFHNRTSLTHTLTHAHMVPNVGCMTIRGQFENELIIYIFLVLLISISSKSYRHNIQ